MVNRKVMEYLTNDCLDLMCTKNKTYKDTVFNLGNKGLFVHIYDKVSRIKSLVWDNDTVDNSIEVNETVEDTVMDLINYGLLMLYYIRDESYNMRNGEQLNLDDFINDDEDNETEISDYTLTMAW